MSEIITVSVTINAKPSDLWYILTNPGPISRWMGEPEMELEIQTTWEIGSPVYIRGFHHIQFENRGIVLKNVKDQILSYSHLSSVSRLPDTIDNYSILEFVLTPVKRQTLLTLNISNFPTEAIAKHMAFFWRGTVHKIKREAEIQFE